MLCGPRLARAAKHGGVLNAPNGTLIVDAPAELVAYSTSASAQESDDDVASTPPDPRVITIAIWLLSVLLIGVFGAMATFGSPVYYLGVIVTFIPLAAVAGRSS